MRIAIFGATGMVGQGVLRECLHDPRIERVVTVVRGAIGQRHDKLRELVAPDVAVSAWSSRTSLRRVLFLPRRFLREDVGGAV